MKKMELAQKQLAKYKKEADDQAKEIANMEKHFGIYSARGALR